MTIRLSQRDGMAELQFSDSGCGMSQEVLENIFEPFYTRSRTGKGTGLGLTISHRIITQHGGEIEATSPGLNLGSTFTVRLPVSVPDESSVLPGPGAESVKGDEQARRGCRKYARRETKVKRPRITQIIQITRIRGK